MDQLRPHYFNNTSFLTKGSQVEVSSDEDGLNGAWFVATVIHPPPSTSTTKKNKYTRNNLVYVEYHNLQSEDGSSRRLREYANVSYVRPSPQPDTNAAPPQFQLNDLVDAFYKDGWWTGVITAVVDSSNFLVTFQNPPDQIQFNSSDLRVHRRWDGGRWVQPEIQRTAGLMFTVGKKVEVCFEGEILRDAWFPATVVENLGNNSFLVEYQKPGIGEEATLDKVTVDCLHIRPTPPHLRDKNFVLLEKVDAFYDYGWWSGVITKELADNRYNVFFKNTKKEREFDCSRVRPHMEWKGGQWFTTSQRSKRGKNAELMNSSRKKGRLDTEIGSLVASDEVEGANESQQNMEKDITAADPVIMDLQSNTTNANGTQVSEEQLSIEKVPNVAEEVGLVVTDKSQEEEGVAETPVSPTPRKKRGRPPRQQGIVLPPETPTPAAVNDETEAGVAVSVSVPVMEMDIEGGERSASSVTKPLEQPTTKLANDVELKSPPPQPQEGKKYSSMKGKGGKRRTISLNSEEDSRDKDVDSRSLVPSPTTGNTEEVEVEAEGSMVEQRETQPVVDNFFSISDKFPFKINSPLWKTVESMEAFRKFPQKPHFRPLEAMKESSREGEAIGRMVNFANMLQKTCGLRCEDSNKKIIEDYYETVSELEAHGFEVGPLKKRLTGLLQVKEEEDVLLGRKKEVINKLEETRKSQTEAEELEEIGKELKEFDEELKQLVSQKEKHGSVTKAAADRIRQQLDQLDLEFNMLAAAPFRA